MTQEQYTKAKADDMNWIFPEKDMLADDYELKPEVHEFYCSWKSERANTSLLFTVPDLCSYAEEVELGKLVGKKTRVTIEVIHD